MTTTANASVPKAKNFVKNKKSASPVNVHLRKFIVNLDANANVLLLPMIAKAESLMTTTANASVPKTLNGVKNRKSASPTYARFRKSIVNQNANANVLTIAQAERCLTETANAFARVLDHLNTNGAKRSKFVPTSARAERSLTTTATANVPKATTGVWSRVGAK